MRKKEGFMMTAIINLDVLKLCLARKGMSLLDALTKAGHFGSMGTRIMKGCPIRVKTIGNIAQVLEVDPETLISK